MEILCSVYIRKDHGDGSPFVRRRGCGLEGYLYRSLEDAGLVEGLRPGRRLPSEGCGSSGCSASVPTVAGGMLKLGWFNTLKASSRSVALRLS